MAFNPYPKKPKTNKVVKRCALTCCISNALIGSDYCHKCAERLSKGFTKREVFKLSFPKKRLPNELKSIPELVKAAEKKFNKFIRDRDRDGDYFTCISCSKTIKIAGKNYHAGHFYSGGKFRLLKFDEDNVHGQCEQCNVWGSNETGINYQVNLIKKIGEDRHLRLRRISERQKTEIFKWDRTFLLSVLEKY